MGGNREQLGQLPQERPGLAGTKLGLGENKNSGIGECTYARAGEKEWGEVSGGSTPLCKASDCSHQAGTCATKRLFSQDGQGNVRKKH